MFNRTLNQFCIYYIILGAAAAGTLQLFNYVTSNVSPDVREVGISLTLIYTSGIEALVLAGVGALTITAFSINNWRGGEGWLGGMLSVICLAITATAGFVHAVVTGEARSSLYLLGIPPIIFVAVIAGTVMEFVYRIDQCVAPVSREKVKRQASCTYVWIALSLLGAPGLVLYYEAVLVGDWSPWWTLLFLVAYAGALRVLVPIAAQLLKWPIITEEQMSP
jgi:hypothetical protein